MKQLNLLLLFICFSWTSFSQKSITGVVKDESGMPIPGVNIIEKGTQNGTVSDFDGLYEITVNPGATLVFSSIGFKTQEIVVGNSNSIDISLPEDTQSLDEIVVVGYGEQKKESVLGAINQVDGEELIESGTPNLTNALNGISPGLNVVVNSGQPGRDDGDIFIRGNANPLILVDGVEIVGGFSNINPSAVESISVLKDGAATAVYGIRGANGVIIITTKRGKKGKPKVNYSNQFTIKNPTTIPSQLNAFEAQSALNTGILNDQAYTRGYSTPQDLAFYRDRSLPYIYPDTNWFDLMIKESAFSQNHTLDVRGGTDFVKYFASVGYLQEGDIVRTQQFFNYDPTFKFDRYSFRANLDFSLTKTTTLRTSISNRFEQVNAPIPGNNSNIGSTFRGLYTAAPGGVVPLYPEEVLIEYPDPLYPGLVEPRFGTGENPYAGINTYGLDRDYRTVFAIDFELQQELDFVTKGLSFLGKYNYSVQYNSTENISWNNISAPRIDTYTLERDGSWSSFEGRNYERPLEHNLQSETMSNSRDIKYYRLQMNYNRTFGKHNVTGLALFSRNKAVQNTDFPFFNEDWVGRVTYNYDLKYFLELNGSYNGDETFAEGYRFKFFPAIGLGYNLAKEDFVKDLVPALNNFKIRYSYGETGDKSGLGNNRWVYRSFYDYLGGRETSRYFFGVDLNQELTVIGESQIGSPTLTWATVTKENIGLDFGLLKNKITGSLDFFRDQRDDLINRPSATIPIYFGSTAQPPFANLGARESKGYEVSLNYRNTTSYEMDYSVGVFYSYNDNRIVYSTADGQGTPQYTTVAGKPAGVTPLLQTNGYFQNIDELVNYPVIAGNPGLGDYRYIDYNANGSVTGTPLDDQVRFDLPNSPRNSYSFRFSLGYKGWSLSGLFNGTIGHKGLIDDYLAFALPGGSASGRPEQLDYWRPDNPNAAYPALHASTTNPNLQASSTALIEDLDYIKLRSLNLGYQFDMSKSKVLNEFSIYANGNNLLTISKVKYGDPEGNTGGGIYPIVRRISLGIRAGF